MKQLKYRWILLTCFVITLSAGLGLKAHSQDTIVLKTSEFDRMANDLMTSEKLSANFRNGFDSLRSFYNELLANYEQSQSNLASCMRERDTAHKYIDLLRTQLSQAWTQRDIANQNYQTERSKKQKAFGIGLSTGYNPFTRLPYFGIGVNWSIIRFSLRGALSGDTPAQPTGGTLSDRLRGGY